MVEARVVATFLMSAITLLTVAGIVVFSFRRLRDTWRTRRDLRLREAGLCSHCGYDLREHGSDSARCPECGGINLNPAVYRQGEESPG
ncbi:MAG TPA: hypothetical protein VEA69_00870 [Tepidisphaeraceae bacterium]|nr:hypothetical protein [Tepidisphaeraceae bacterium]